MKLSWKLLPKTVFLMWNLHSTLKQAPQLEEVPKNCTDIGVDFQVCVTDAYADAIANGVVVTPFWSGMEISVR
jgi:hypothetical protein